MFGFFKKKPSQQSPPPVPMPKETKEKIDALNRHLSEFAEGDVHPIEGALAMLLMDKNRHIFEFMHALATSTVELVLSENDPTSPPLLLLSAHNYPMLAVFTQQKRAAKCQEKHPEQRFFLRLPFTVALKRSRRASESPSILTEI